MIPADRFDEIVSRCLAPTLQQHGLRGVATGPYEARFEGTWLVVVIGLDVYRTSELHAWVGQPDDEAGMVSVDTLEPPFVTRVATDEHELADAFDHLASFLMTNQQGFLSGDPLAFVDLVDHLREMPTSTRSPPSRPAGMCVDRHLTGADRSTPRHLGQS